MPPRTHDVDPRPDRAELQTERGLVRADVVAEGVVRIRIRDDQSTLITHSYAVGDLPATQPARVRSDGTIELTTGPLTITIDPATGAIEATDPDGVRLVEEPRDGFEALRQGYRWRMRLAASETCHGLGERAFGLSLRGRSYKLWNYATGTYLPGDDPLYLNVPFYLGQRPEGSYGLFWDNPARSRISLDARGDGLLTFECERRPAVLYVIAGPHPADVVRRFTGLVGAMPLPPLWALGYQQSRWGYPDAAHFRGIAARMRHERIPCDALHFDIDHMHGHRVFTWDPIRFPDPHGLLSDLRADGFHSVAILDPAVKVDPDYGVYRRGQEQGVFCNAAPGRPLIRRQWAGRSVFPDFTSPGTRQWWTEQVAEFAAVGLDGLWADMNEPAMVSLSRTMPDDTPHDWEGEGSTHVAGGHAVYGMQMARATRDGLAALRPDRRPFVISRAGYAGLQRHSTSWTGDSRATWGSLRTQIPLLLNLGMSGIAFSGSDAGGYRGNPSEELFLRWLQLASMTPFFRTHSSKRSIERNPWSFGALSTDRVRAVVERRYRLLPYLYTAVQRACAEGTPIMRPLFFDDPGLAHVEDEFLLGEHLLVAPIVHAGARGRTVALPPGDWYADDSSTPIPGGSQIYDAAGWGLPLYVRAGAVIPTWPVVQSTSEAPERLILTVYAGRATSHLYEDAGDGLGYADGDFSLSTFTTESDAGRLSLVWASEGDYLPPLQTVELRVLGLGASPSRVTVDGTAAEGVWSDGVLTLITDRFAELLAAT